MGKVYLLSDTHLKHQKVATYCKRPEGFTELIHNNVMRIMKPEDTLIHLGDVGIDKVEGPDGFMKFVREWPGHKVLVRGNHDGKSCQWYTEHGFDFACDAMVYRSVWLTHKPWLGVLPEGTHVNVHGHLHNVWDGFLPDDPEKGQEEFTFAAKSGKLLREFHRLFAVEYTNYCPVEFDKFVGKPDKYQARHPSNWNTLDEQRKRQQEVNAKLDAIAQQTGYAPSMPDATGNSTLDVCPKCGGALRFCQEGEYCSVRGCTYAY